MVPLWRGLAAAYRLRVDEDNRIRISERLTIVEGLLGALDSWVEVTDCIWKSADRSSALEALQARFGFSERIANFVLDMQTSRTTEQARSQLLEEAVELRQQL